MEECLVPKIGFIQVYAKLYKNEFLTKVVQSKLFLCNEMVTLVIVVSLAIKGLIASFLLDQKHAVVRLYKGILSPARALYNRECNYNKL